MHRTLGDIFDSTFVPSDGSTAFPVDLSQGLDSLNFQLTDTGFLDPNAPIFDPSSLTLAPLPSLASALPASAPNSTVFNPATNKPDTGMSTADWTNTLAKLAQTGVETFATVKQIQAGNSAPFTFLPTAAAQPTGTVPEPTTGFSLASLTDFTTPWPYVAGAGVVLLIAMTSKKSKK